MRPRGGKRASTYSATCSGRKNIPSRSAKRWVSPAKKSGPLIGTLTQIGLVFGNLLAGAVIVETVFAWPGIGQLAIQSIAARDFLVVQTVVLFVSTIYIAMNLAADLAYAAIDPRIRLER